MNISINVLSANKTIVGTLDVNDPDMNIVYQMSDVREPDKRKTNYVRQFSLPGTKNNNILFSHIFENGYNISDIDISVKGKSFNPNLKLIAQVILNNNVFFEGNLQLNKINKIDNKLVGYEVTIYGTLADFFGEIGDADLNVIDLSEYNHILTRKNIVYSWNERGAGKYIAERLPGDQPYNRFFGDKIWKYGSLVSNDIGDGYVYPLFYNGGEDLITSVTTEKWQPSIYVYTIMKKIFDKYGYKWNSKFFESEMFKRLIIPFSKDSLLISKEAIEKNEFRANVGIKDATNAPAMTQHSAAVAETKTSGTIIFDFDTTSSASPAPFNAGGAYNKTTGIWTSNKNGQFHIQAKVQALIQFACPLTFVTLIKQPNMPVKVKLINVATNAVLAEKSGEWTFVGGVKTIGPYTQNVPILVDYEGYLAVGTKVKVIMETTMPVGTGASKTTNIGTGADYPCVVYSKVIGFIDDSSYFGATIVDKNAQDGDQINMNQCLPEMSIKDFLLGINKVFNLYWMTSNDKEFIIEPRDDIFKRASELILDWTKQVDNGEILSIEPLYDLTANKYLFTYKSDNDYHNKQYTDAHEGIYGDKTISIDNDFQTEVQKIETIFSASPLMSPSFNSGITLTPFVQKDGLKYKRFVPKIRLLYWGGMKPYSGTPPEIDDVYGSGGTYEIAMYGTATLAGGAPTSGNKFPYAGHLDDTKNPTLDLNYGVAAEYYFTWNNLTDNNLYNKYWRGYAEELIDPNQHLLTCKLYLPGPEMRRLDLRTTIQLDNVYYRINKITYNPMTGTAEAELFKLKDYKSFTPSYIYSGSTAVDPVGTINTGWGGWGVWRGDGAVKQWSGGYTPVVWGKQLDTIKSLIGQPTYQWQIAVNAPFNSSMNKPASFDKLPLQSWGPTKNGDTNSYADSGSNLVLGKYNVIAPTAKYISIQGSFNNVADSAQRISVVGDYNTVLSNVSNVSIVGNNIVASKSNTSYVDGVEIGNRSITMAKTNVVKSPTDLNGGVIMGGKNSVGSFAKRKASRVVNGNGPTFIAAPNTSAIINPAPPQLPPWTGQINNA